MDWLNLIPNVKTGKGFSCLIINNGDLTAGIGSLKHAFWFLTRLMKDLDESLRKQGMLLDIEKLG